MQPYIRPFTSIYAMISQDQTPNFSNQAKNLFVDEEGLPNSGTIQVSALKKLEVEDVYGRVQIPSVDIDVPLLYGATPACLRQGAGQRIQSHMPGYQKPVMIGGHTIPFFKPLVNVSIGDIITIKTYYGVFEYKITGTAIANEWDTSAYDLTLDKEQLILFTCYPPDGIGQKEDRFFVYADKISGPRIVGDLDD